MPLGGVRRSLCWRAEQEIVVADPLAGMLAPGTGAIGAAERRQVGSGTARSRARAVVKVPAQGQRVGR